MSDQDLIAGFLILWLKKCIVPSLSKEAIAINMAYLAVLSIQTTTWTPLHYDL